MHEEFESLLNALSYQFRNPVLMMQALTHRSVDEQSGEAADERSGAFPHNERLEFLGDAVINLVVGELLMIRRPKAREGVLSKTRAQIVSTRALSEAGKALSLGMYLRISRGADQGGTRSRASIIADAFEAVIGAIYIDGGFEAAKRVVEAQLSPIVDGALRGLFDDDFKTRLQEMTQAELGTLPNYSIVGESGPDHNKTFVVAVSVAERELARASGPSKKSAEQDAARQAMQSWKKAPS